MNESVHERRGCGSATFRRGAVKRGVLPKWFVEGLIEAEK